VSAEQPAFVLLGLRLFHAIQELIGVRIEIIQELVCDVPPSHSPAHTRSAMVMEVLDYAEETIVGRVSGSTVHYAFELHVLQEVTVDSAKVIVLERLAERVQRRTLIRRLDFDPETAIERAIGWWQVMDTSLLPPATVEEVGEAFARLDARVSQDVLKLYSLTGGMGHECKYGDIWRLWSLDELRLPRVDVPHTTERPLVYFADYFIESHLYAFHFESDEHSSVHMSADRADYAPHEIAGSVEEFLQALICHPASVDAHWC
jgi:hypothetical protein